MKQLEIFPEELEYIIKKKGFIPKPLKNNSLKINHKYYISGFKGVVKVEDIINIGPIEYYIISYSSNMSACISNPSKCEIYELIKDSYNFSNENIINSGLSYYGYEIKYWFIKNQIDFHKIKYKEFYKYFIEKEYKIEDNKKYILTCERSNGKRNCKIISK